MNGVAVGEYRLQHVGEGLHRRVDGFHDFVKTRRLASRKAAEDHEIRHPRDAASRGLDPAAEIGQRRGLAEHRTLDSVLPQHVRDEEQRVTGRDEEHLVLGEMRGGGGHPFLVQMGGAHDHHQIRAVHRRFRVVGDRGQRRESISERGGVVDAADLAERRQCAAVLAVEPDLEAQRRQMRGRRRAAPSGAENRDPPDRHAPPLAEAAGSRCRSIPPRPPLAQRCRRSAASPMVCRLKEQVSTR